MNQSYPKVGVGVVLKEIDGKSQVMMHQRKGSHGASYWGTGGGHLELGESLMAGALRELSEEAGEQLKVKNVKFLGVKNFTEMQPKNYVDISFSAEYEAGEPVNNAPDETTDWQWFSIDQLPSPLFPPVETYLAATKSGEVFFDSSFSELNTQ
jgi:8-oxo-dGTP diphosphatase